MVMKVLIVRNKTCRFLHISRILHPIICKQKVVVRRTFKFSMPFYNNKQEKTMRLEHLQPILRTLMDSNQGSN